MKLHRVILVAAFVAVAMPALAQTIDGSTVESYERSAKAMIESLPEADRVVFAKGMMNMIITGYPAAAGVEGLALMSIMPAAMEAAHITLDGVTFDQIMERGRSLADNTVGSAASVESSLPAAERTACLFSAVTVDDAKVENHDYATFLTVTVTNGLAWALSGIQFDYSVATPGRSVPWLEDSVSLSISGGIEPGETRGVSTSLFGLSSDAVEPLVADVTITDVADQHRRLLLGGQSVMGWSDELSDFACP